MSRKYRGKYDSPLECFRDRYSKEKISRGQLQRKDSGLYGALYGHGQLDEAIPEKQHRNFGGNPLIYYKKYYEGREDMTRNQLKNEDCSLYNSLLKTKQLDEAIPETNVRKYRGRYDSPLECFRAKFGKRKNMTRGRLHNKDKGLYGSLIYWGQLDEAIPEKAGITYRGYESPLECFRDKFGKRKITRGKLHEKDSGLSYALRKRGQLDEAIPEKAGDNYRGYSSPLECFRDKFGKRKITRKQLYNEDGGLHGSLIRAKQLDEAIPECVGKTYRGYASPLECFKDKYAGKMITRGRLGKEDQGLYCALKSWGQLDEAIREKRGVTYRGFESPLAFFKAKYEDGKITRKQLEDEDWGLYQALFKAKQMDEAIPNSKISEKEKLEVMLGRMTG